LRNDYVTFQEWHLIRGFFTHQRPDMKVNVDSERR